MLTSKLDIHALNDDASSQYAHNLTRTIFYKALSHTILKNYSMTHHNPSILPFTTFSFIFLSHGWYCKEELEK